MKREKKIGFLKEYLEKGGCYELLKKYGIGRMSDRVCAGCPIHPDGRCSPQFINAGIAKNLLAEFEAEKEPDGIAMREVEEKRNGEKIIKKAGISPA